MPKKAVFAAAIALFFACPAFAAGNDKTDSNKQEVWQPILPGPFTTFTAPLAEPNKCVVQPLYFFYVTRGVFDGDGKYRSLPNKDYKIWQQAQLYVSYAPTDRVEFNAQPQWDIISARVDGSTATTAQYSDTLLNVRCNPVDESYWCPRITPMFQVKLPTGKYQDADPDRLLTDINSTGSTDYWFGASFTKGIKPVELHLDAFWVTSPAPVRIDGVKTKYADRCVLNGAFEWVIGDKLNLMSELLYQVRGDTRFDGELTPSSSYSSLLLYVGIGYSERWWQVLVGYGRTLAGENEDADDIAAATITIIF
jgi:hypothetical protein